jgi:hypothetical protein
MISARNPSRSGRLNSGESRTSGAMSGGTLIGMRGLNGVRAGRGGRKGRAGFGAVRRGRTFGFVGRGRVLGEGPKTTGAPIAGIENGS